MTSPDVWARERSPSALPLRLARVLDVVPSAPFHFDATLNKPDHFATPDMEWRPGIRWQTMRWENQLLGLKFENAGSADDPGVRLSVWAAGDPDDAFFERLASEVEYRCNLALDLAWEDLFWQRVHGDVPWLEKVIRL